MDERPDRADDPEADELRLPQDLEPDEQDATEVKGGLLLPAVQKIREPAVRTTPP